MLHIMSTQSKYLIKFNPKLSSILSMKMKIKKCLKSEQNPKIFD